MLQLTQKLKSGVMEIKEVPVPLLQKGQVLVRNHYSFISAGTEESTVKAARKGYIGKAKERPQQVKQVLETLKSQGLVQTYRAVMKKLDAYSPGSIRSLVTVHFQELIYSKKINVDEIKEVPVPLLQKGYLLVRNHYSFISAGTEESTVKAARKGYIGEGGSSILANNVNVCLSNLIYNKPMPCSRFKSMLS